MATKTKKATARKTSSSKSKSTAKSKAKKSKPTNGKSEKSIAKSSANKLIPAIPSFRSLIDSFWDSDNFFGQDVEAFINRSGMPAVNIKDNTKTYEVKVAVPGLDKRDINITVNNGVLCIKGEKEISSKSTEDNFTRREYSYNNFIRNFTLPENANPNSIKARFKNGELTITLGKTATKKKANKTVKIS